jgi:soluble lytic murein transglycosylase
VASNFSLRRALISAAFALGAAGAAAGTAALASDGGLNGAQTLQYSYRAPLSDADARTLGDALEAARRGDTLRIRSAMTTLSDPLARKIALWALVDTSADGMSFAELEGARRDLAGWPGPAGRESATEKVLEGGGMSPTSVISWFAGADPTTAQGAMALAAAYQSTGQQPKAAEVIRRIWRTRAFDATAQQAMLTRFGSMLTADDHVAREDMLLYGSQGEAARELIPFLPADQQALAQARMAIREGLSADGQINALPASVRNAPGLAYEQALKAQRRGDDFGALALIPNLPAAIPDPEAQHAMWRLRKGLVIEALKSGDSRAAYRAAAGSGCDQGQDGAEAEFYAGWIALARLKDPRLADTHFAKLQQIGQSPITASRALYWRGRAAEAEGDMMNAQLFYAGAAKYPTAFYGQLGAAKAGQATLTIGRDPVITAADRARFEDRDEVRAARMLATIGAKDTFARFMLGLAEVVPSDAEAAQLVDLARNMGDQYLSMKVVRAVARHGFVLPERGYPLHSTPGSGTVETAYVLGITRQESGFDPHVRSPAGATGMMQLMPATARTLSHKYGFGAGSLEDADYNMQLGAAYLGQLLDQFGGSFVMATAGYNAGPGRPTEWTAYCGDPRMSSVDPADYIECIPFSETRDYVMRVMEGMQVYRARLNGGTAKLTLPADLKRGGYGYSPSRETALSSAVVPTVSNSPQ